MVIIRDRILEYLGRHPEGADDDELAVRLKLRYRQQANSRCRMLAEEGLIHRLRVDGKLRNFIAGGKKGAAARSRAVRAHDDAGRKSRLGSQEREWFWEGNVQAATVSHLAALGFSIERVADTASKEAGKDIMARRQKRALWVTVKGYPRGTPRTQPTTQARHWFKQAVFDIVDWRNESSNARLVLALPDFPTYRRLSKKLTWLQRTASFSFLWVDEQGAVTLEGELE